jgi:hypothetical protein
MWGRASTPVQAERKLGKKCSPRESLGFVDLLFAFSKIL